MVPAVIALATKLVLDATLPQPLPQATPFARAGVVIILVPAGALALCALILGQGGNRQWGRARASAQVPAAARLPCAQGFLLGKPTTAERFSRLLQARNER